MPATDAAIKLLKKNGFRIENFRVEGGTEALYLKPRPGGSSIYITIPMNQDIVPNFVVEVWMKKAGKPREEYSYLLSNH